jgi:hypothetical protein
MSREPRLKPSSCSAYCRPEGLPHPTEEGETKVASTLHPRGRDQGCRFEAYG